MGKFAQDHHECSSNRSTRSMSLRLDGGRGTGPPSSWPLGMMWKVLDDSPGMTEPPRACDPAGGTVSKNVRARPDQCSGEGPIGSATLPRHRPLSNGSDSLDLEAKRR